MLNGAPAGSANGSRLLSAEQDYQGSVFASEVSGLQKEVSKRFLVFRPFIDPMNMRPYKPPDRGYFYKMYNGVNISIVKYTFEDNGFREVTNSKNQDWSVMWTCSSLKS